MKTLLRAGAVVQHTLESRGWSFCFIGGIANYRWGTPRLTNDLDLTLLTGFGTEASYVADLLREFESRIPDAATFAAANRVLLLRTPDGFGVDVALGAMPFEERTIARATDFAFLPGATLRTCSAEDLIVHKAFAARPQDWVDIEGVILKQRGALRWRQIRSELVELAALKETPELSDQLERIADRVETVIGPFDRSA
jgi:hypothetical protein